VRTRDPVSCTLMYMSETDSVETSTAELRRQLAEHINDVAVRGRIVYVTSRGRRVAALVPVEVAEAAERGAMTRPRDLSEHTEEVIVTDEIKIDVRFEPDHEAPMLTDGRPMLTWGRHPEHGNGWTLSYLEDPDSETSGVDDYFIPGDLTDVDAAVASARGWLALKYSEGAGEER
jgi:prevent-host-death family protein